MSFTARPICGRLCPKEQDEPIESHISGRMADELDDEYVDRPFFGEEPAATTDLQERLAEETVEALAAHAPVEVDVHTSRQGHPADEHHNIGCVRGDRRKRPPDRYLHRAGCGDARGRTGGRSAAPPLGNT